MNRIAERREQALRRDALFLAEEFASPGAVDRLFQDVEIPTGYSPLRLTVASSRTGKLYLRVFFHEFSQIFRGVLSDSYDDPRILGYAYHGLCNWSATKGVMVAELLDRTRTPCLKLGETSLEPGHAKGLANWSEHLDKVARAIWLTDSSPWGPSSAIPRSPELHQSALADLLGSLDSTQDAILLETWLEAIVQRTIVLPDGTLPDSPAITIIRRILEIDVRRGLKTIRALLRPNLHLPFRFGYFQLSLTGILLARLSTASSFAEYQGWIWDEIDYLREQQINSFEDFSLGLALLAALLAVAIMVEDDTAEAIGRLDEQLQKSLKKARNSEDRKLFLRFLGDSLNQAVTSSNLPLHLSKLMVFLKQGKDEPSLVRQQNRLLRLIRDVFEPAREMLMSS